MSNFFEMSYCDEPQYEEFGVAYAPEGTDIFLLPPTGERVEAWVPITLELRDGEFADYLSSDLGARLCSEKMKLAIDRNRTEVDEVQWLPTSVEISNELSKAYFILHFPRSFEIFNQEKSIMASDVIVRPVLDNHLVHFRNIFGFPSEYSRSTYVSSRIKAAIEAEKLTGVAFTPAEIA